MSAFKNIKLLTDVKESSKKIRALTYGGFRDSTKRGILPGFFPVWVNGDSRLNILDWKDARERYHITVDMVMIVNKVIVHLDDGRKMVFEEVNSGLYLYWMNKESKNKDTKRGLAVIRF